MSQSIGYLDAWREWAAGSDIQHRFLAGLPILWWGRIGKVLAFLGGGTVVLDLIGPERLREWGRRREQIEGGLWRVVFFAAVVAIFASLFYLNDPRIPSYLRLPLAALFMWALVGAVWLLAHAASWAAAQLCNALDRPMPARGIRWAGAATLLVGFHFDLLAS